MPTAPCSWSRAQQLLSLKPRFANFPTQPGWLGELHCSQSGPPWPSSPHAEEKPKIDSVVISPRIDNRGKESGMSRQSTTRVTPFRVLPHFYLAHRLFAENTFDSIQAIHETTRTTRSLSAPFRMISWIVLDAMSVNAAYQEFGHYRNAKARLTGSSALRYSSLPIRPNKPFGLNRFRGRSSAGRAHDWQS